MGMKIDKRIVIGAILLALDAFLDWFVGVETGLQEVAFMFLRG